MATNSSLTTVYNDWDSKTRLLVDVHLDRNQRNLEKKSSSLFFMLLPLLFVDGVELYEETALSLDIAALMQHTDEYSETDFEIEFE